MIFIIMFGSVVGISDSVFIILCFLIFCIIISQVVSRFSVLMISVEFRVSDRLVLRVDRVFF